mgnify:CR=1 FL=1|jgi:hypothetical protein
MAGYRTNDPEGNAARLRARFARFSGRSFGWTKRKRRLVLGLAAISVVGFILGASLSAATEGAAERDWPVSVLLRHIAAAPNCEHARAVGLAPARIGEPGYYPSHDRDRDGIACEPWPR